MKNGQTNRCTDGQRVFYYLPPRTYRAAGDEMTKCKNVKLKCTHWYQNEYRHLPIIVSHAISQFLHEKLTEFAFIINNFIISYSVLNNPKFEYINVAFMVKSGRW